MRSPQLRSSPPCNREAGSVAALIEALSRFDYPADRYEIALRHRSG